MEENKINQGANPAASALKPSREEEKNDFNSAQKQAVQTVPTPMKYEQPPRSSIASKIGNAILGNNSKGGTGIRQSEPGASKTGGSQIENNRMPQMVPPQIIQSETIKLGGRVKEGFIKKWVNYLKGFKPRYFVLTSDLLLYYKAKNGQVSEKG